MIRRLTTLLVGAFLLVLGGTYVAFFLGGLARGGLDPAELFVLIPAAFAVVGAVLVVTSLRGMHRSRQRRAMPLAEVRAEPVAAGSGRWTLKDVASAIARRLQDEPCSVHHAGERIQIRWAGDAAQERCELRDAGDGELSHADVMESTFEVQRLHRGVVVRLGQATRSRATGTAVRAFDTLDRRAVHAAIDEVLAVAGWSREG